MNYILLLTWIAIAPSSSSPPSTLMPTSREKKFHPQSASKSLPPFVRRIKTQIRLLMCKPFCGLACRYDSIVWSWYTIIGARGTRICQAISLFMTWPKFHHLNEALVYLKHIFTHSRTNSTNTKYRINFTEISIHPRSVPFAVTTTTTTTTVFTAVVVVIVTATPFFLCGDFILSSASSSSSPSSINKYLFSFLYKHTAWPLLSAACGIHLFYLHHKHRYTSVKNEKTLIEIHERTPILPLRQCLIL